ncbi:MAG: DUF4340 domain-containing protein [Lachnospiraceae bacterium]|nr:DUF4340 domain-containing protein [Lachnospiraceae bacterium]
MNKQKKQLILLIILFVMAVTAFGIVSKMSEEEESKEAVNYTVTNLEAEAVNKLTFTNETGTYILTKQDGIWSYEGDKTLDLDEEAVQTMVGKVGNLTSENCIEQVEDLALYGLDVPEITILVSDGTDSYTLFIGNYNEVTYTQYLCLESDMETVYTTTSYQISSFKNGIDDLIVEEEEMETVNTEVQ